jgi:hypothetical protein
MTSAYGRAVLEAERALGRLLAMAENTFGAGRFSVIVTADHGGHGRDHGSDDPPADCAGRLVIDAFLPLTAGG